MLLPDPSSASRPLAAAVAAASAAAALAWRLSGRPALLATEPPDSRSGPGPCLGLCAGQLDCQAFLQAQLQLH